MDWTLAHHVNAVVATHDLIEDPVTAFAVAALPLYALATLLLWLLDRPYAHARAGRSPASPHSRRRAWRSSQTRRSGTSGTAGLPTPPIPTPSTSSPAR